MTARRAPALPLRARVKVNPEHGFPFSGEVRGRSLGATLRYDIMDKDGVFHDGITADRIELDGEEVGR